MMDRNSQSLFHASGQIDPPPPIEFVGNNRLSQITNNEATRFISVPGIEGDFALAFVTVASQNNLMGSPAGEPAISVQSSNYSNTPWDILGERFVSSISFNGNYRLFARRLLANDNSVRIRFPASWGPGDSGNIVLMSFRNVSLSNPIGTVGFVTGTGLPVSGGFFGNLPSTSVLAAGAGITGNFGFIDQLQNSAFTSVLQRGASDDTRDTCSRLGFILAPVTITSLPDYERSTSFTTSARCSFTVPLNRA